MNFTLLFEVAQTGNRIDLLTCEGRANITNATVRWWQSQGWEVVLWDNTGNLPSVGRNKIIQDFQSSDRNILIMADDDITLYTHRYLTADWLKQVIHNGVYTLNSNHKMGVLKYNSTGWDDGNHHWRETHELSQLYVIADKTVPLQDETLPALEDLYWAKECNSRGIKTQLLHTVFLREQSQDKGSLLFRDRQHRKEVYAQARAMKE
tara:strand:+ start:201 stop:821 length:621 start_codon:yes stop_codon:yes gene_type:complete